MAKKRVAVQMSLTIPPELRREMEEVGDGVNWSQVASEAFRAKVLAIKSQSGGMGMEDVIARIRAADELVTNEFYKLGKDIGTAWASEGHPKRMYQRLESLRDDPQAPDADGIGIYHAINGSRAMHWRGAEQQAFEFWELFPWNHYTGWSDDNNTDHFAHEMMNIDDRGNSNGQSPLARGFIEGALEVWQSVRDKL